MNVDRVKALGALLGFFHGDALAMPVHWYYDTSKLRSDFGRITKYEAPKPTFPGSILNLSNTGGGGRGSDSGNIIGTVILHGKKKYWMRGGNYHYHHGMLAGENTLDALVTKVLGEVIVNANDQPVVEEFRNRYITFMTTPGSHNDTYAGSCHRMFFKNLTEGKKPQDCPDNDNHNVDSIDALMTVPVTTIAYLKASSLDRYAAIKSIIQTTRKTTEVLPYANAYSDMLIDILVHNRSFKEASVSAGNKLSIDVVSMVDNTSSDPVCACYISSSFPVLLYFAYKYGDLGVETLLLASTNAGGENVARGSLLGALAGAKYGYNNIPDHLREGLVLKKELEALSYALLDKVL